MHYSPSLNSGSTDNPSVSYKKPAWIKWTTRIIRLLIGGVFIFSGFTKSVDPWGTLYKFEDYLAALDFSVWPGLLLVGVFALCSIEFMTGVFVLTGCFRRISAWMSLAIMAFMLPLSLWVAAFDPVEDCGCFGDALIISNWATFAKNVVLIAGTIWLARYNRICRCIISPSVQWMAFTVTAAYILTIGIIGYNLQPLIDFRPYKIGSELVSEDESASETVKFVYTRGSEQMVVDEDDELPDEADGWEFKERIVSGQDSAGQDRNLRIWDSEGEDVTDQVLAPEGECLILFMPELKKVSISTTWKINSLYNLARANNIEMMAVVAGNKEDIDHWTDLSLAAYDLYIADDTQIKEVVRGNPAIIFTRNGIIEWKSSLKAIDIDMLEASKTEFDPMTLRHNDNITLRNITALYISVMAVLVLLSFLPRLHGIFGRKPTHDDKVHHEV